MARHGSVHINAPEDDLNWSATGSLDRFYSSLIISTGVPAYALTGRRDALRNRHQAMTKLRNFGQASSQIPLDDLEHALCLKAADKDVKIDQDLNGILTDAPAIRKAAAYLSPLGPTQLMQTLQRTLHSELPYVCFGYTGFEERCKELLLKLQAIFDYIWAVIDEIGYCTGQKVKTYHKFHISGTLLHLPIAIDPANKILSRKRGRLEWSIFQETADVIESWLQGSG